MQRVVKLTIKQLRRQLLNNQLLLLDRQLKLTQELRLKLSHSHLKRKSQRQWQLHSKKLRRLQMVRQLLKLPLRQKSQQKKLLHQLKQLQQPLHLEKELVLIQTMWKKPEQKWPLSRHKWMQILLLLKTKEHNKQLPLPNKTVTIQLNSLKV